VNTRPGGSVKLVGGDRQFQSDMSALDTDIQLLERFTDTGDEQAFAAIVKRHAPMVYSTCLRVLGDAARAEEVAQETFFQLVKKGRTVNQSLGGWLHRTATRLAIDALRSDRSRARRERAHAQNAAALQNELTTWQEVAPFVDAALADLDVESRELLVQHFLEGVSQSELAERLGLSRPTVHRRLQAGLEQLRRHLREVGVLAAAGAVVAAFEQTAQAAPPAALTVQLGKMTMISGNAASIANSATAAMPGAVIGAPLAEIFRTAAPMTAVGGLAMVTVVAVVVLVVSVIETPPGSGAAAPVGAAPGIASPPANVDPTSDDNGETVRVADRPVVRPARIVLLEQDPEDYRSDRIVSFQDPATTDDSQLLVSFADTHVQRMGIEEVRRRLQEQTGATLEELVANRPQVTMDQ